MRIGPLMVVIFVAMICGFLLLVYYLYNYVIYGIIAIFAIASCSGMYECINAVVTKLPLCEYLSTGKFKADFDNKWVRELLKLTRGGTDFQGRKFALSEHPGQVMFLFGSGRL